MTGGALVFDPPAVSTSLIEDCRDVVETRHQFHMTPECTPVIKVVAHGFDEDGNHIMSVDGGQQLNVASVDLDGVTPIQDLPPSMTVERSPRQGERIVHIRWTAPIDVDPYIAEATDRQVWFWMHPADGSMTAEGQFFVITLDEDELDMQIGWRVPDTVESTSLSFHMSMSRDIALSWWADAGVFRYDVTRLPDDTYDVQAVLPPSLSDRR